MLVDKESFLKEKIKSFKVTSKGTILLRKLVSDLVTVVTDGCVSLTH